MPYEYHVVDVFTRQPLEGNALAVIADARGLDTRAMQRIAREFNLSETAFLLPPRSPGAAATVRIFTPYVEMAFAGHPTIGTAYVMRKLGIVAPGVRGFTLDEEVGPVPIRVDEGEDPMLWLETPKIRRGEIYDTERCARAIGLDASDVLTGVPCQTYSAGNPNVYVALRDPSTVDRAEPDEAAMRELFGQGVASPAIFAFAATPQGAYSRMFGPHVGVREDPATGSATGPLALFMIDHDLISGDSGTGFVSEQGVKMGRRSLLHVRITGEHPARCIEVGGHVVAVASGTLSLP